MQSGWAWLLMPNLAEGQMAGTAGLAQQGWLHAFPGLPGSKQRLRAMPVSTLSLEVQEWTVEEESCSLKWIPALNEVRILISPIK